MQPRIHDKIGYNLIHTFTCNKLSERAEGQLHYQLWKHSEDQSFGIALSKNESTGGFTHQHHPYPSLNIMCTKIGHG